MKRLYFILFPCFFSLHIHAQKEATWWYFGQNAGMSFTGTGGAPVNQTNGKMSNFEGVASISDAKGRLLFYTDGEQVYNRKHNIMQFGGSGGTDVRLRGHNSSTQSAVIVQQPVRSNRYFVFTVDQEWGNNGFNFSVVDTSANAGDGQVVLSEKNMPIIHPTIPSPRPAYFVQGRAPEKVAAVKHANKVDTWVINHTEGNNNFYAWLLNVKGLNAPVVSSVGPNWSNSGTGGKGYSKGYMKFTPDGTKLICAIAGNQSGFSGGYSGNDGRIEIYDFDNLTGKLSNPQVIDKNNIKSGVGNMSAVYGVEVSPNGRFLYISFYIPSWIAGDGNDGIWQIDLLAGNAAAMGASCVKVANNFGSPYAGGGMQLGPDGKIYLARSSISSGAQYLSCISKPNCQGTNCAFINNAIDISPRRSQMGVPTFINSFFNKAEFDWGSNAANLCEKSLTKLFVTDSTGVDSVKWNFDDPSTGTNNTAKGFTVYHRFSAPRTYSVFVQFYRKVSSPDCYADTARKKLTIFPNPKPDLGRDTVLCNGEDIVLKDTTRNASYIWKNGATVPSYIANVKGWHWVDVKVGGCTMRDSMYLDIIQYPKFNIGNDTLICEFDSIKLTASNGQRYLWSMGDTTATAFAKDTGMVWARATNYRCHTFDTMFIKHSTVPTLNLGRDTVLCVGDSITLQAKTQFSKKYFWSNSSTDSFLKVKTTGTYWARIKDTLCFSAWDTVKVTFQSKFALNLGKDTSFCQGKSFTLNAAVTGGKNWRWHDNSTSSTHTATTGGKKYVTVTNGTCVVSDTILLSTVTIQPFSLGNDTTLCQGASLDIIPGALTDIEFTWMGTSKGHSYPIKTTGKYYVDLRDLPKKVCKVSDTIVVTFKPAIKINLGRDTILCPGQSVDLNMGKYGFKTIKWWDGATVPGVRKNDISRTQHFAEGFDGVCTSYDTINISYRPNLAINLGPDIDLCDFANHNFDLTTANATVYEWLTQAGVQITTTPTFTVSNPGGVYVGRVSDGFCSKTDTVKVSYLLTPTVNIGSDLNVCDGLPNPAILDASAASAMAYQWSTGEVTPKITVTTQGMYYVRASNGKCEASDTAWVYFSTTPNHSFGFSDSVFCDNPRLTYDFTQPNTTYMWNDGYTLPTRKITVPGQYWVVIQNFCGKDSISVLITVDENGCRLNFPSAFSPNGDGINDFWKPTGQVIEWVELVVYNRWGEVIYKGNPANGWDGTMNGNPVQDGVYPVTISYRQSQAGYPRLFVKSMVLHILR